MCSCSFGENAAEVIVRRSPPYEEAYILAPMLNVAIQPYKSSITKFERQKGDRCWKGLWLCLARC